MTENEFIKTCTDICDKFYKFIDETFTDSEQKQYSLRLLKDTRDSIVSNLNRFVALAKQIKEKNTVLNKDNISTVLYEVRTSIQSIINSLSVFELRFEKIGQSIQDGNSDNDYDEIDVSNDIYDLNFDVERLANCLNRLQKDIENQ